MPVRAENVRKEVDCDFTERFDDSFVDDWAASLDARSSPNQRDAVEFCQSVASKWAAYEQRGRIVRSQRELAERCRKDATAESLGVLVAQAAWYAPERVLAFCAFRRTWTHNLVFDFLAVHPKLLGRTARPISGLGLALLYRLAEVARAIGAVNVWAETTDTSVDFYKRLLQLDQLGDLLIVDAGRLYRLLHERLG